jgi:polysaccharide export outer membrane protein
MRTLFLFLFLLVPVGSGAQILDTNIQPPAKSSSGVLSDGAASLMNVPAPVLVLSSGDAYEVKIFALPLYDAKGRIETDGTTTIPLVGKLHLAGLTAQQAQAEIAESLQSGQIILDPQVDFIVTESPTETVSISGELGRPGVFPAFGHHTLADYISRAEGLKPTAGHTITVVRDHTSYQVPLGPDPASSVYLTIPIYAGDSIVVPSAGVVYAVGALKLQGAYPLKTSSRTTALEVVAMGGGAGYEAMLNMSVIVRSGGQGTQVIPVKLRSIMQGKAPDVPMMPNDILLIPTNDMKAAIKGGAANLASSLAAAFIYTK